MLNYNDNQKLFKQVLTSIEVYPTVKKIFDEHVPPEFKEKIISIKGNTDEYYNDEPSDEIEIQEIEFVYNFKGVEEVCSLYEVFAFDEAEEQVLSDSDKKWLMDKVKITEERHIYRIYDEIEEIRYSARGFTFMSSFSVDPRKEPPVIMYEVIYE